jgi:murein DD-endopeptidase MepM/ murein hydrolase activator NlpD
MRYPVGQLGTKDEFDKFWYVADGFGINRETYYHEGLDINLKSGGDTDLGELLYAVGDGKIVYYHDNSHPTKGFGRHLVLECQTPLGTRWFHYCHCQEITATVKEVKRGDVIGKLGKSGTQSAHLHFAVFKVDPSTLRNGIDTIAKTITELNSWWEDPLLSLDMEEKPKDLPEWFKTLLQERGLSLDREGEFRAFFEKAVKYDNDIQTLTRQVTSLSASLSDRAGEVSLLSEQNERLRNERDAAIEDFNKERDKFNQADWEAKKLEIKAKSLEEEIGKLNSDLTKANKTIEELKASQYIKVGDIPTLKLIWCVLKRFLGRR